MIAKDSDIKSTDMYQAPLQFLLPVSDVPLFVYFLQPTNTFHDLTKYAGEKAKISQ